MKTKKILASLAMGFIMVSCGQQSAESAEENAEGAEVAAEAAEESVEEVVKTSKDFIPSKSQKDSVSYLIGVNFGSFIKGYNFGEVNERMMIKGIRDFMKAKGNFDDPDFAKQFKINPEEMNDLFNEYLENRHNYIMYANKEKGEKFLADNAKKEGVQICESGLQYIIEEAGNGNCPNPMDTVKVIYKGQLLDGTVFDQTKEGDDPAVFPLNGVISGWTEGLQKIGEGGKIRLFVPSDLAYGEMGNRNIEANSTLIFDVELVSVSKYVEPVAEEESGE